MTAILDKEKILEDIEKLSLEEQLELIERLLRHIRVKKLINKGYYNWNTLYGLGKNLWEEDAQEYINRVREDR
jgi:hypothetical protein